MPRMSIGQFREFAARVIANLPEVDPEEAQIYIQEPIRIASILRNAFQSPEMITFKVRVGSWLTAERVGEELDFISNLDTFLEEGFRTDERERDIPFYAVKFGVEVSGLEAVKELKLRGFRPATFTETMYFLVQHVFLFQSVYRKDYKYPSFEQLLPLAILDKLLDDRYPVISKDIQEMFGPLTNQKLWADTQYAAVREEKEE